MNRRNKAAHSTGSQHQPFLQTRQSHCHVPADPADNNNNNYDNHHRMNHSLSQHASTASSFTFVDSSCTTNTTSTTTSNTTKRIRGRWCTMTLRNAITRMFLQQRPQPFALVVLIPICLWINSMALSSSQHFHWESSKYHAGATTTVRSSPRMVQLQLLILDNKKNNNENSFQHKQQQQQYTVRRLAIDHYQDKMELRSLQQQRQQQQTRRKRGAPSAFARTLDTFWDNQGHVHKLRTPDDMRTRETCEYVSDDDWQRAYHPSCNDIHAVDLVSPSLVTSAALINSGAYRDVWKIPDFDGQYRVLKTLRYLDRRQFDLRNFDRHRRDAVAMEQLKASKYTVDIHGYCSNSALFDYSDGGDLWRLFGTSRKNRKRRRRESSNDGANMDSELNNSSAAPFWPEEDLEEEGPTKYQLLQIAHSIASAVRDTHHVDSSGRPTIAHTDIKPDQWILSSSSSSSSRTNDDNGRMLTYQLADFNRVRFLTWDTAQHEACPFTVGKNEGPWRSPEEYNYGNQTEKGDIWSLGNMLYFLISGGNAPFAMSSLDEDEMMDVVKQGGHPDIEEFRHDNDSNNNNNNTTTTLKSKDDALFFQIMKDAMMACYVLDPVKRPGADKIVAILEHGLSMSNWTEGG